MRAGSVSGCDSEGTQGIVLVKSPVDVWLDIGVEGDRFGPPRDGYVTTSAATGSPPLGTVAR